MTTMTIDTALYWRLPGPRDFITRIEENAPDARMLWINLPNDCLPGTWDGVQDGLRHAHVGRILNIKIGGGTDICSEIGVHFNQVRMTAKELVAHHADQKSAVILMPSGKDAEKNCEKFANEYLDAVESTSNKGNVLLIVGGHIEFLTSDTIENGVQVIAFDGGLSQDEMDAYVAIRMLNRPGPGSTRLTRAIVSEFAGFDVELAEQIMQLSESQIVNLVENLPLLMGESPLRWRYDSWLTRTRSKAMAGVSHALHDKYLSEHGPVAQREDALNRIKRRYWRACVKTISPWLEERRQQVINVFSKQIDVEAAKNGGKLLKPASNGTYIELSRSELEYNNIVGMERSGKITANTPTETCAKNVCFLAKKVRDDVAHLRMPSLITLNDLIREMDRLQTVI